MAHELEGTYKVLRYFEINDSCIHVPGMSLTPACYPAGTEVSVKGDGQFAGREMYDVIAPTRPSCGEGSIYHNDLEFLIAQEVLRKQ